MDARALVVVCLVGSSCVGPPATERAVRAVQTPDSTRLVDHAPDLDWRLRPAPRLPAVRRPSRPTRLRQTPTPVPVHTTRERLRRHDTRDEILACIRKAEGSSWTSVSPGGTYRGAFQMNRDFWITYGGSRKYLDPPSWERASKAEQNAVAWRGYLDRGYQPWPPAMRRCR